MLSSCWFIQVRCWAPVTLLLKVKLVSASQCCLTDLNKGTLSIQTTLWYRIWLLWEVWYAWRLFLLRSYPYHMLSLCKSGFVTANGFSHRKTRYLQIRIFLWLLLFSLLHCCRLRSRFDRASFTAYNLKREKKITQFAWRQEHSSVGSLDSAFLLQRKFLSHPADWDHFDLFLLFM